jgi:hypothetical protein
MRCHLDLKAPARGGSTRFALHPGLLLLSPVAPLATFSADAASPTGDPETALVHIAFTASVARRVASRNT